MQSDRLGAVSPDESTRENWTDPGVYEVAAGVYRIPLPLPNDGLRAVNVYLLVGADGDVTFVDAGWAITEAREVLDRALAALDITLDARCRYLVSHVHRDHYSQAVALRAEFGGEVSLGAGDQDSLDLMMDPDRHPLEGKVQLVRAHGATDLSNRLAERYDGATRGAQPYSEYPDTWLQGGERIHAAGRDLDVVPTPGHTRGHMVFHATDDRILFAGDHVLPTITPSIGFEPAPSINPLGSFLGSLAIVRSRPDSRLLPAHGPVSPSAHARIDELIDHHGHRLDEAERAIAAGATTSYEVAQSLRWTRRETKLDDLDLFNQLLAVCETAAHLDLLAAQGRLHTEQSEGRNLFSIA